jgi:hypothetical protein
VYSNSKSLTIVQPAGITVVSVADHSASALVCNTDDEFGNQTIKLSVPDVRLPTGQYTCCKFELAVNIDKHALFFISDPNI